MEIQKIDLGWDEALRRARIARGWFVPVSPLPTCRLNLAGASAEAVVDIVDAWAYTICLYLARHGAN